MFWKKKTPKKKHSDSDTTWIFGAWGFANSPPDPGQSANPPMHGGHHTESNSHITGGHHSCSSHSSHSCGGHSCGGGH